jgi:ABC-2 type transport system permease protein
MSLSAETTLARYTFRQILARRRALALAAFALLPSLIALVHRANPEEAGRSTAAFVATLASTLIVSVILPLAALVVGTGVFGAEIEDGTALYVLAKPMARWRIVLVRVLCAGLATAALASASVLLAGTVAGGGAEARRATFAFAAAVAVGALVYCAVFVMLSLATRRALVAGLAYVVLWEGALSAALRGLRFLSVRQYTLSIAGALGAPNPEVLDATLGSGAASAMAVAVAVLATAQAVRLLRRFEVGEAV